MTLMQQMYAIAADRHGYLVPEDVREAGGSAMALVMLAQRGTLNHIDRGIYRLPALADDPLARQQEALLRLPGGILSHDTALALAHLADVNPQRVHVTMPPGYQLRKHLPGWIVVHRARIEPQETTYIAGLAITTPVRTIVDSIEGTVGGRFAEQAFTTARRRNLLSASDERRIRQVLSGQARLAEGREPSDGYGSDY